MSRLPPDFVINPNGFLGEINRIETWWIERQEALERAGYMLRPRYRPGWKPSWVTTGKYYAHVEDGQTLSVRAYAFALGTRAHELSAARLPRCHSDL